MPPDFAQSTTRSRLLAIDRLLLGPQARFMPAADVTDTLKDALTVTGLSEARVR
jgi:hypothetical protein